MLLSDEDRLEIARGLGWGISHPEVRSDALELCCAIEAATLRKAADTLVAEAQRFYAHARTPYYDCAAILRALAEGK